MLGYNVTQTSIRHCHELFSAGSLAIKTLGPAAFAFETNAAPHLVERYIDWQLGGIEDMAIWSARMWDRMASWIENGPPPLPTTVPVRRLSHQHRILMKKLGSIVTSLPEYIHYKQLLISPFTDPLVLKQSSERLSTATQRAAQDYYLSLGRLPLLEVTSRPTPRVSTVTTPMPFKSSTIPLEYFGSSMAVGDFDHDGAVEVAVGSWGSRQQRGAVP